MAVELVGWVSAVILGLTVLQQLIGQWRERGVLLGPSALLAGHLLAGAGLCLYAVLRHQILFGIVTATVLLGILGALGVARHNRYRRRRTIPTRRSDVIPFRPRHRLLKRYGSNR